MPGPGLAPSSVPGPTNLPGTIEAYATAGDHATDYVIASVVSEGWMANNGAHFGACLRVTWRGEKRELKQIACPSTRIRGEVVEKELNVLNGSATVNAVHTAPCDPPVAKVDYGKCGG